jgi:hypothetical protein
VKYFVLMLTALSLCACPPPGGGGGGTGGGDSGGGTSGTGGGTSGTGGGTSGTGGGSAGSMGGGSAGGASAGGSAMADFSAACTRDADCGTGRRCDTNVPTGYCYAECMNGQCPAGASCVVGGTDPDGNPVPSVCLKSCTMDSDCRMGLVCVTSGGVQVCEPRCTSDEACESGTCDLGTGKCTAQNVGAACTTATDCTGGLVCASGAAIPGGYCTRSCGQDACPAGSTCVQYGESDSVCFKDCDMNNPCRMGYDCVEDVCVPRCTSNAGCGSGERCDVPTGRCVEAGPAPRAIGAACSTGTDCDSTTCVPLVSGGSTADGGGFCTADCSMSACPGAGVCLANACGQSCTSNADCRDGWVCTPNPMGGPSVCVPSCIQLPSLCDMNEVCLPDGRCVVPPSVTPQVSVDTTTPADFMVPFINTGSSAPLTVTVGDGGIAAQVVIDGPDSANLRVTRITGPGGLVLFDRTSLGTNPMKVFNFSSSGAMSVLLPNSPDVPFSPGDYEFQFGSVKNESVTVNPLVNVKYANTPNLPQATMDIAFVFVGSHAVITNAAAAQTNPEFQTMVNTFKQVFADGGVNVGTIDYIDATPQVAGDHAELANGALGDLVRTTASQTNYKATVFWVQSIAGDRPGFTTLGMSAGIPGGLKRGSGVSGVVMGLYNFPNGFDSPTRMARTLTHEFGHWLGLFHATEGGGTSFDPLADTPECPKATYDANNDGVMSPGECTMGGAENLMFWTQDLNVVARERLTQNQRFVLQRNPAAR